MNSKTPPQHSLPGALSALYRTFDAVATWVTQLSWWKFFLFAALLLVAGQILQNELFAGEDEIVQTERARGSEPTITIDDSGIRISPRVTRQRPDHPAGVPEGAAPVPPLPPQPPGAPKGMPGTIRGPNGGEVHINLPPQMSEELSDAIEAAVDDAAEAKARSYHKQASTWFTSFVWLLVMALFGTKALVGGKKRAEAEMQTATAAAERESMQRQLSEARMQAMQAQVEPHFLFNTLASVEHLIETDPPRASAMQRSLIQYLRAVLPQMRDNHLVTNLGREVDMVTAYLDLLKMRMEERLCVDLRVPAGLRSAAFPPMMLQSLVENAIKHGLECKPEGGRLQVAAEVVDSRLRVTVADDGAGFGVMPGKGTGLGLNNIRDRLKLLHGEAGQLSIAPNSPAGVIATIEVPYQLAAK